MKSEELTLLEKDQIRSLCLILVGFAAVMVEDGRTGGTVKACFFQHSRQNIGGTGFQIIRLFVRWWLRAWLLMSPSQVVLYGDNQ